MPIYSGPALTDRDIALCTVVASEVLDAPKSLDYASEIERWVELATTRDDILYFGVRHLRHIVGQIFLHDWDREAKSSLVGYHLYSPEHRGLGIGTRSLHLLLRYVIENTDIERLTAITTEDNIPSRVIGQRNGFVEVGRPREDRVHGVVMEWRGRSQNESDEQEPA